MTPEAICYFVLGLLSLLWPVVMIFFKRSVLGAQWLLMGSSMASGCTMLLYSTLFNSFLCGEYLLVIMYMLAALATPMVMYSALAVLLRPRGVGLLARLAVAVPATVALLMAASVAVGGADMYRLWVARAATGDGGEFYEGSWRYNVIVAVHYWLFATVAVAEAVLAAVAGLRGLHGFGRLLGNYYAGNSRRAAGARGVVVCEAVLAASYAVLVVAWPFASPRGVWAAAMWSAVAAAATLLLGWYVYRLDYGAERLPQYPARVLARNNIKAASRRLADHVEGGRAYLDPDISVFLLASTLKMTEDDVIDCVHHLSGGKFGDYIAGLRVEYAAGLLRSAEGGGYTGREGLTRLAHRCGFLDLDRFDAAFRRVMHCGPDEWMAGR